MTPKKAIEILTKHADSFLSGVGKYIFVSPQDEQDLLDACQIATDALRKTIPVQPFPDNVHDFPDIYLMVRCPTCKHGVFSYRFEFEVNRERHRNICVHCGQRFTEPSNEPGCWEDVEDCEEKENEE